MEIIKLELNQIYSHQTLVRKKDNYKSYKTAQYNQYINEILWQLKAQKVPRINSNDTYYSISILYLFKKPKTTNFPIPTRKDLDNVTKPIMDTLETGKYINNDKNVFEIKDMAKLWSDNEKNYVYIKIRPMTSEEISDYEEKIKKEYNLI